MIGPCNFTTTWLLNVYANEVVPDRSYERGANFERRLSLCQTCSKQVTTTTSTDMQREKTQGMSLPTALQLKPSTDTFLESCVKAIGSGTAAKSKVQNGLDEQRLTKSSRSAERNKHQENKALQGDKALQPGAACPPRVGRFVPDCQNPQSSCHRRT